MRHILNSIEDLLRARKLLKENELDISRPPKDLEDVLSVIEVTEVLEVEYDGCLYVFHPPILGIRNQGR